MKARPLIKAVSAVLSALMLVGTAETALTAFAAEGSQANTSTAAQQTTVSQTLDLEAQAAPEEAASAETQAATTAATTAATQATTAAETAGTTAATAATEATAKPTEVPKKKTPDDPVGAPAGEAVGEVSWSVNSGVLHINGTGDMQNYYSYGYAPWYSQRDLITRIVINNGVTSVGNYAFYNLPYVTSVSIPDTVTHIGCSAFQGCSALTMINIPDSVTTIGSYAFYYCSLLESVRMSNNVKEYSYELFSSCTKLKQFTIPDGVVSIRGRVFSGTSITDIRVPNSVTYIEGAGFAGLTDVTVRADTGSYAKLYCDRKNIRFVSTGVINHEGSCGENITYFLDSAACTLTVSGTGDMANCSTYGTAPWYLYRDYVKKVVIESGVTSVGNITFYNHEYLSEATIPDTVTAIGYHAFQNCPSLTSIVIPDSVASIGSYAFYNCSKLGSVTMSKNVREYAYSLFEGCSALSNFTIPDGVVSVRGRVFSGTSITDIRVPNSVTYIEGAGFAGLTDVTVHADTGSYAKLYCDRKNIDFVSTGVINREGSCGENVTYFLDSAACTLTVSGTGNMTDYSGYGTVPWYLYRDYVKKVVIESGVTSVGNRTFYNHEYLNEVTLANTVTTIGYEAFRSSPSLTSIVIPDSVTSVGGYAFCYCSKLSSVTMSKNVKEYDNSLFYSCSALSSFTIPDGVISIKSDAFRGTTIQTLAVPNSVTYIGGTGFAGLTDVTVYADTGSYAKLYCNRNNIKFKSTGVINYEGSCGENVTYFLDTEKCTLTLSGTGAMSDCGTYGQAPWDFYRDYVKKVVIQKGITSIGNYIFYNHAYLSKVTIPDTVTRIGSYAFQTCPSLKSVTIPDSVTSVGSTAFYQCTGLKEVRLSENIPSIGRYTFANCSSLVNVVIPRSVTWIDYCAFQNNTALTAAYLPETVTAIDRTAFGSCGNLTIFGSYDSEAFNYAYANSIPFLPVSGAGDGMALCTTGADYAGMALRFVSQDGEKTFSRVLTEESVNAIYGLDTDKTYTAEICSNNGNVFCSQSNISFGANKTISVNFENSKKPLDVSVEVLKENGEAAEGCAVRWTDQNGQFISDSKTLRERIENETLTCAFTLPKTLLSLYRAPQKASLTLSESADNKLSVTLVPYTACTLSGVVTDGDGEPLSGVIVTAEQQLGDGNPQVNHTVTDNDGAYTFELMNVAYKLTACRKGYSDSTASGTLTEDTTQNIQLEKLSNTGVSCKLYSARLSQATPEASFENVTFTVYNQTEGKAIEDFTVQNQKFYFKSEDYTPGDELTCVAKDYSGVYADCETSADFTAGIPSVIFVMKEKGVVSAKIKNTQNDANVMLLFDSSGKYVETARFKDLSAKSGNLSAGSYTAVLMGEHDAVQSVAALSDLTAFGLENQTDYVSCSVTVEDGKIAALDDVIIPLLNTEKLSRLDSAQTSLTSNNSNVSIGAYFVLTAKYAEKEDDASEMAAEQVVITIPENAELVENGVSLDGLATTDYSFTDGVLTVNTNADSATVRIALYNVLPTEKALFTSQLKFTCNAEPCRQPIGSTNVKLGELDWTLPAESAQKSMTAIGTTYPNAQVELYDNGMLVATATARLSGEFTIPFELLLPFTKSTHQIYLIVTNNSGITMRSQTKTLQYDYNKPILSKVHLLYDNNERIIDFLAPRSDTVSYRTTKPTQVFTYQIEFSGDASIVTDVAIVTVDVLGKETEVPAVYDEESGMFVCSHEYTQNALPRNICVKYDNSDYDDSAIDMVSLLAEITSEEYHEKAVDSLLELDRIAPIRVWKDDNGDYAFGAKTDDEKFFITLIGSGSSTGGSDSDSGSGEGGNVSGYKASYYIGETLVVTAEANVQQVSSTAEVQSQLTQAGYQKAKDAGSTFEQCDLTPYIKQDGNTFDFMTMLDPNTVLKNTVTVNDPQDNASSDNNNEGDDGNDDGGYDDGDNGNNDGQGTSNPTPDNSSENFSFDIVDFIDYITPMTGMYGVITKMTDGKYATTVYETITGDSFLNHLARYYSAVDRLERCYEAMGKDPALVDDLTEGMGYLLWGNGISGAANYFTNAVLSATGGLLGAIGGAGFVGANAYGSLKDPDVGYQAGMSLTGITGGADLTQKMLYPMAHNYAECGKEIFRSGYTASFMNIDGVAAARSLAGLKASLGIGFAARFASNETERRLKFLEQQAAECDAEKAFRGIKTPTINMRNNIDPSGYICEAVDSNRLEGVTCTAYYSPNADGSDAVVWDAYKYDQENPLVSNAEGHYEWFVPEGYWQVKYEKEGYTTTYSDWLPVPPPQTEVNIAMTSLDAPKLKHVYAYQNEIDLEFTQYMNVLTVSDKTVTVTLNGEAVSGKLTPANGESGFDKPVLTYATKFRFVPDEHFAKDDVVTVAVSGAVNYADNTIADCEGDYTVALKPETITAAENISVMWKDTAEITIQAQPGEACANSEITVTSNAPSMVEVLTPTVTTDEDGRATVRVKGALPGTATLTYSLTGSDCTGAGLVAVEIPVQQVKPVTASVTSGSTLKRGTTVSFSCATKGAEIYYTTDLSCPCALNSDSRIKYTGPIEITEYTTIIAYAVKEGMENSKTALFIYDVESLVGDANGDGVVNIRDVTAMQRCLAELEVFTDEQRELADVNGNGEFDVNDITHLQMYLAEYDVVLGKQT